MRIEIKYEASWRNSFLDGDNLSPGSKKGRTFIGSITQLKIPGHFKQRDVTHDTVMGILNRLIGDQRKLYQARANMYSQTYYFADLEHAVSFVDQPNLSTEIVYLRNMNGNYDRNAFSGVLKPRGLAFSSDYSTELWGIMELDVEHLCQFIIGAVIPISCTTLEPLYISHLFDIKGKIKPINPDGIVKQALLTLHQRFPQENYLNNKGMVIPSMLYCSAMYIQLERLHHHYDMSSVKTKNGNISGLSKRSFTKRDFLEFFTTGQRKKIWGNPYIKKERIKGEGDVTFMLTKANGQLDITIDVDKEKSQNIIHLIEMAGVSSFYLGKKGLAYVSNIRP